MAGSTNSKKRMKSMVSNLKTPLVTGDNDKKKMSYTGSDLNKLKKDFPESHFRYESNIKDNEGNIKMPALRDKYKEEVWQVYPKRGAFGKSVTPGQFQADPSKYSTIAKEYNINNPSSENVQYYRQYK